MLMLMLMLLLLLLQASTALLNAPTELLPLVGYGGKSAYSHDAGMCSNKKSSPVPELVVDLVVISRACVHCTWQVSLCCVTAAVPSAAGSSGKSAYSHDAGMCV
jgi:hypothetical protein